MTKEVVVELTKEGNELLSIIVSSLNTLRRNQTKNNLNKS